MEMMLQVMRELLAFSYYCAPSPCPSPINGEGTNKKEIKKKGE
jgi:hypothetical protein